MTEGKLSRVVGALAEASGMPDVGLNDLVRVGESGLLGEVLRITGDKATLQVFEDTNGLALEEPVYSEGTPLTVELGPGLLGSVLDGVGRPLHALAAETGNFIPPGARTQTLPRATKYPFTARVKSGDTVGPGDILGTVLERGSFEHRVMVPPGTQGVIQSVSNNDALTVDEVVATFVDGTKLTLMQRWPVRRPRPGQQRLDSVRPFLTGQRVFDFLFPVAEGGTVAVPGGFGTGKTIIEQSLAKYSDADVVIYIGCGERGNEMAEVLRDFSELRDPRHGRAVLDRTVLLVNTSNMPVAARESSVYLGLTVAEYFRDMGYRVAVMAD